MSHSYIKLMVILGEEQENSQNKEKILAEIKRDLPQKIVLVEEMEKLVDEAGNQAKKEGFLRILEYYDTQLSAVREHWTEECKVTFAGKEDLEIASIMGRGGMSRQRCECKKCEVKFFPFHQITGPIGNIYITEKLRERGCEKAKDMVYKKSHEEIGLEAGEADVISVREVKNIVEQAGKKIRDQEMFDACEDLKDRGVEVKEIENLMFHQVTPPEINVASDGVSTPPLPESKESQEVPLEIEQNMIKSSLDGVVVRKPQKKQWTELCVADVRDTQQVKAISDSNWTNMVIKLLSLLLTWDGFNRGVILFVDGAPILKVILETLRFFLPQVYMILDWFHLIQKCKQRLSMACKGKEHRQQWLRIIMPLLWEGKVGVAIWKLKKLRKEARNPKQVDLLIEYLSRNQAFIPNYHKRKELGLTNGSHRAEKACDLLVSKRMKDEGMHWSEKGADAICALRTISRNGEWNRYFRAAAGF